MNSWQEKNQGNAYEKPEGAGLILILPICLPR
jgi:hypothetical protein